MFLAKLARSYSSAAVASSVAKTPFYGQHKSANGKLVNFSNYLLPVQYADQTIVESHLWTRKNVSVFDVSHMLQTKVTGARSTEALESLTTANLRDLPIGHSKLTMFVHQETGGILDDLIITRTSPQEFYVVTNANCRAQDTAIFLDLKSDYSLGIEFLTNGLLAIQGPQSQGVLSKLFPKFNFNELFFMQSVVLDHYEHGSGTNGSGIRVTRCGYTGEDGFEVSVPESICAPFLEQVMTENQSTVRLAGLGARDTLRLEAGLCLYGSDMNHMTLPREAGLSWLMDKRRVAERSLPSALLEPQQFPSRKRIGFLIESEAEGTSKAQPIPRAGMDVVSLVTNNKVGTITSGGVSPTLMEQRNRHISIGMAYVELKQADAAKEFKIGNEIGVRIRDKVHSAFIAKMPFVPSNYFVKK